MKGSGISNKVQTIPNELQIEMNDEDANDLNFIVQNTPKHARLTGTVVVKDEYAKDLSVVLSRASNPTAAIKRTSVSMSKYFEFSKISAGNYVVRVESKTLSSKHFLFKTDSVKVTIPSKVKVPSIHTKLSFDVSTISIDEEVDSGIFFHLVIWRFSCISLCKYRLGISTVFTIVKITSTVSNHWIIYCKTFAK